MMHPFQRTRIAPTPSGFLHLGNAFSFLLTAGLAGRAGARLLLRIDDADAPRVRPEYTEDIFSSLEELKIRWEEGPGNSTELRTTWSQQHRAYIYDEAMEALWRGGYLFACTCSRARVLQLSPDGSYPGTCLHRKLPPDTAGACWRLGPRWKEALILTGMDNRKSEIYLPPLMQHFVVRKKDGGAAYQLASLADDLHFGVDVVVRGADLLPSTAAQLVLARLLSAGAFQSTRFLHHPLLTGPDGEKLSKSAGATSLQQLKQRPEGREELQRVAEAAERMAEAVTSSATG